MKSFLVLSLFSLIPLLNQTAWAGKPFHAPEVSGQELEDLIKTKGITIIDANSADTYNAGHIPTAISFAKHKDNLQTLLPKDKSAPIAAYCGGPQCTAWEAAAEKAKNMGYTNIRHYKGGIKTWKKENRAVEKAS